MTWKANKYITAIAATAIVTASFAPGLALAQTQTSPIEEKVETTPKAKEKPAPAEQNDTSNAASGAQQDRTKDTRVQDEKPPRRVDDQAVKTLAPKTTTPSQ